MKSDRETLL